METAVSEFTQLSQLYCWPWDELHEDKSTDCLTTISVQLSPKTRFVVSGGSLLNFSRESKVATFEVASEPKVAVASGI